MLTKFAVDYVALPHQNTRVLTHRTDDPIEAEEFLMHLLAAGAKIKEIRHEGAALGKHQFDRMVKIAAERIAGVMLCQSLGLDYEEVKSRFGFPV